MNLKTGDKNKKTAHSSVASKRAHAPSPTVKGRVKKQVTAKSSSDVLMPEKLKIANDFLRGLEIPV